MIDGNSTSLSKSEVAELAEVTERTVSNWERKGLLNRTNDEGPPLYDKTQVLRLEEARTESSSLNTRYTLVNLKYRVEKLEKMMDTVRMMFEIKRAPMNMDAATAQALLHDAGRLMGDPAAIDLADTMTWSALFPQLDEAFFSTAAEVTGIPTVWSMVYDLCLLMQKRVTQMDGFDTSLDLQMLHAALAHGRKEMRPTILMYLAESESGVEDLHDMLFGSDAGPKERLLQKLAKKRNS